MANREVSRVGFCQKCKDNPPAKGTKFVLMHGTAGVYKVHHLLSVPISGFTPHVFAYAQPSTRKNHFVVSSVCCIDGCGVSLTKNNLTGQYNIKFDYISYNEMTFKSYNALRKFSDTGYEVKEYDRLPDPEE